MAQNDMLKRYLEAGLAFTKMTQERAEAIVRDLVRAGEVGAEQASSTVDDIVARSRENTERLFESVRTEIRDQVRGLGLATTKDLEDLRAEIAALSAKVTSSASSAPAAPTPQAAETATARKAPATKAAPAKAPGAAAKVAATKAPAKATATASTKAPAKKAGPTKKA